ncbi:DUF4917 family protein [Kosakonia sp. R1.Fl]|uniref:DUF4917 family protein n=1 Tax=Kosakonia sp. R1.Fl TaxID=2928706 RepID=UPI00201DA5F6|nr:DUF4917 family protein [Kosakonia sp. R1.Fl]MCL6742321.1 DUF4917 family protein [Kosakonia sp. R1.Fl]
MPFRIYNWVEIANDYNRGSLLLGNGASMAIDDRFGYSSIIEYARDHGLLTDDIEQLFCFFNTADFELVLRLVWQASNVNRSLRIPDERTHAAYVRVRECLIQSVRDIHPEHQEISRDLPAIYNFIKRFSTVISLNYDLIIYWAIMYGTRINDNHLLKDCFVSRRFYENWRNLRESFFYGQSVTLVFYPHGNLVLCRNNVEAEFKITNHEHGLLETVLREWQSEQVVPLFVSEGTAWQKINSIQNSSYLNTVYREVLTSLEDHLVIYGWGLWPQDEYILQRIVSSGIRKIAVSVYRNDQAYCNRVYDTIIRILGVNVQVDFFNSESPNCWNNID